MSWAKGAVGVWLVALGTLQCSPRAPIRTQLVVVIDTDAHVVSELASHPEVSADATIDSLRIDVLDTSNTIYDTNLFLVADASSWPVSFGVVPAADGPPEVRVRIRAFRAHFARPGSVNGSSTLDPFPEVTIDRLAWVALPASGTSRIEVSLDADCLGVLPSFAGSATTCIDGAHPTSSPRDGLDRLAGDSIPQTRVGTWRPALERPCATVPSGGRVCIPGGFSVLGDYDAVGGDNATLEQEPIPLHPVVVAPFLLDRDEFTVERARKLVLSGALPESLLRKTSPGNPLYQYCTWLGSADASNDDRPLNCIPYETALLACQHSTGTLPTEAQWLHAARGRGEGRRYPWGNDEPRCCALSAGRGATFSTSPECPGTGIEPVASHPIAASCGGLGDVSKDGVVDLAGSVGELLLDDFQGYSGPCWGSGILYDPVCRTPMSGGPYTSHGGNWSGSLSGALLAPRGYDANGPDFGFRCAYADAAQ